MPYVVEFCCVSVVHLFYHLIILQPQILQPPGIFKQHFNVHVFLGSGDRFHHDWAVCFTPGLVGILSFVVCMLRAISTERWKTKTKVIRTADQRKGKYHKKLWKNQSKNKNTACSARQRVRPTCIAISFSFQSDWLRGWREFSGPIK